MNTADRQAKIYYQIGAVLQHPKSEFPDAVYAEYENYRSDFHYYDTWSESDHAEWEAEHGFRPTVPLTTERRAFYKEHGFEFKHGGVVLYEGVPCHDWTLHA